MTNLGEKMSDDEVDELLKAVDTSSGEINYTGKSGLRILFRERLADVRPFRSRPDHPRQLMQLSRPLLSPFLSSTIHILQALFLLVHGSRPGMAGDVHICTLFSALEIGSRK